MGKGDKKTKKGKIAIGSYGNSRKRTGAKSKATATTGAKTAEVAGAAPAKAKKTPRKKSEA